MTSLTVTTLCENVLSIYLYYINVYITFLHQVQNIEYINNILDSVFSLQLCRRCRTLLTSSGGHTFDKLPALINNDNSNLIRTGNL